MDRQSVSAPEPGASAATPAQTPAASLTPRRAMEYFEFFKPGSEREVVLLGDLVEQRVHFVKSKNHKVLCASGVTGFAMFGDCAMCELAAESADVSTFQVEYYAPAYVRPAGKGGSFSQRVVVFTAAAGEKVLRLVTEGSHRGHRLRVRRPSKQLVAITIMEGPPTGLSYVMPPAFDMLPFVRARFGRPQEPGRPLVFLPPLNGRDMRSGPISRPKPLDLSPADVARSPEEIEAVRGKCAEWRRKLLADPDWSAAPEPAAAPDGLTPPAPVVEAAPGSASGCPRLVETPASEEARPRDRQRSSGVVDGLGVAIEGALETIQARTPSRELRTIAAAGDPAAYGPKQRVGGTGPPEGEGAEPGTGTGMGTEGLSPVLKLPPNHPVRRNGQHRKAEGGGS